MVYYDNNYNQAQTHYTNHNNYSYSHHNDWNNQNGNGWTAMWYARQWYPGWQAYNFKWQNNCWWVYMSYGNYYKTVCVSPNYSWHTAYDGYMW